MVFYESRLQIDSTESKIVKIGLDFAEKSWIEVERNFGSAKSRFEMKFDEIGIEILI